MMTVRKNENMPEGNEALEELSLGQALAVLKSHDRAPSLSNTGMPFHAPGNEKFLSSLRERRERLKAHAHLLEDLFTTIPEQGCEKEYSFLADNPDFFLAYITLTPQAAKNSSGDFFRLFEHMNNCFMCFEEYSLVLRDYYHKMQELSGHGETNTVN